MAKNPIPEAESDKIQDITDHIGQIFHENKLEYGEVLLILEAIKFDMMLSILSSEDE